MLYKVIVLISLFSLTGCTSPQARGIWQAFADGLQEPATTVSASCRTGGSITTCRVR